jgi:hypothetical protein
MNVEPLKTLLLVSSALLLTACGALADAVNQPPRAAHIVSGPQFTGQQSPFGPLKRETTELRERLKDPKAFYRYQYSELWVVGAFPIERGVIVFAAPGRPLRSTAEIAAAAQCVDEDLRRGAESGARMGLADKKLLLTGTNWQDMNEWHQQYFGKNQVPLGRSCRISVLFDM